MTSFETATAEGWFPKTAEDVPGWRLDIVSLLAVIGESSMAEHSQAMTATWTCCLPRIIPAPQALLKPTRPTRMPQVNAAVVGVVNGTFLQTLNYFPNILHPIEDLPPFAFRTYTIEHSEGRKKAIRDPASPPHNSTPPEKGCLPGPVTAVTSGSDAKKITGLKVRTGTMQSLKQIITHSSADRLPPHVPVKALSPLNLIAYLSCFLTAGLLGVSVYDGDGVAILALTTISLASSIVGYASMWSPQLMKRNATVDVPRGDVVIRTREGAFIVVKCEENVARELYTGTEECVYTVQNIRMYRFLVGLGTFLLMVSVVFLGNCNFRQQAAIGGSYIVLNGLYWLTSVVPKKKFWDVSLYDFDDNATPEDSKNAENGENDPNPEKNASFTRTLWYAIRETKEIGWVTLSGAVPRTPQWDEWLKLAGENAKAGKRDWNAVTAKNNIVGRTESTLIQPASPAEDNGISIPGGQHVPAWPIPPERRTA